MAEESGDGWMKPKQSFRLKRTVSRKGPELSMAQRSLPVISQAVKRKNSFDTDSSVSSPSRAEVLAAKKQRLGEIFSPSSNFLQSQSKTLPSLLQRRVSEFSSQSTKGEGERERTVMLSQLIVISRL